MDWLRLSIWIGVYGFLKEFRPMTSSGEAYQERLIKTAEEDRDCCTDIVPFTQYYKILCKAYFSTCHGGRDQMREVLKVEYYIPKWAIEIFLKYCPFYLCKKTVEKSGVVVKPIVGHQFNKRCQIDLIDFQGTPDGTTFHIFITLSRPSHKIEHKMSPPPTPILLSMKFHPKWV